MSDGLLSHDDFADHVRPLAEALQSMALACRAGRGDTAIPMDGSVAMGQMSAQSPTYMFDRDEGVVDVAVTHTNLLIAAGESHTLAYVDLLLAPKETYVWTMPVVVRAATEAFSIAHHLAGTPTLHLLAGRVINELLDSARQIDRAAQRANTPNTARTPADRLAQAEAMHLRKVKQKRTGLVWLEEPRPSKTELIKRLFQANELGAVLYSKLSAVSHSNTWGLSLVLGSPVARSSLRPLQHPIQLTLQDVQEAFMTLTIGLSGAFHAYAGWTGVDRSAFDAAGEAAIKVFDTYPSWHAP